MLIVLQQPTFRQPFRRHHEPRQPEALVVQAEADQQAVSSLRIYHMRRSETLKKVALSRTHRC